MIKFKAHFKNQTTNQVYDHNFNADSFEQAYRFAQETRLELIELGAAGWRVIGVYEILYNVEKLSTVIH
tara:strand:- start:1534 stop:1740 length:207 start_codon:yes stop_codon:yes gene_type:complete